MNYEDGENEIVSRLNQTFNEKGLFSTIQAAPMPETENEFTTFFQNFKVSKVAVQYVDSTFLPQISLGIATQEELVRFRLILDAKKLRGSHGVYRIIELIKESLLGFQLENADRLTIVKYGLLEFSQNHWQPYLEFECKTLNVQSFTDSQHTGGAKLNSVVYKDSIE